MSKMSMVQLSQLSTALRYLSWKALTGPGKKSKCAALPVKSSLWSARVCLLGAGGKVVYQRAINGTAADAHYGGCGQRFSYTFPAAPCVICRLKRLLLVNSNGALGFYLLQACR